MGPIRPRALRWLDVVVDQLLVHNWVFGVLLRSSAVIVLSNGSRQAFVDVDT